MHTRCVLFCLENFPRDVFSRTPRSCHFRHSSVRTFPPCGSPCFLLAEVASALLHPRSYRALEEVFFVVSLSLTVLGPLSRPEAVLSPLRVRVSRSLLPPPFLLLHCCKRFASLQLGSVHISLEEKKISLSAVRPYHCCREKEAEE